MCGRLVTWLPRTEMLKVVNAPHNPLEQGGWNIAPTDQVSVVTLEKDQRHLRELVWGLPTSHGSKVLFNARAETVLEKPSFAPSFRSRRCLVPVAGWYEWMLVDGKKSPHYIHRVDHQVVVMAGLFQDDRFAILTCEPSPELAHLHNRMPVVLRQRDWEQYLDSQSKPGSLQSLLRPFPGKVWARKDATYQMTHRPLEESKDLLEVA